MKFLQIGLGGTAEFAYLSLPDWRCHLHEQKEKYRPPMPLRSCHEWQGYLIDAHPYAFYQTYKKVQQTWPRAMSNLNWILGAIYHKDINILPFTAPEQFEQHRGWSHVASKSKDPFKVTTYPEIENQIRFHVASITADELISYIDEPDFIIMDLEGAEVKLLKKFLKICPNVKAYHIETHTYLGLDEVMKDFKHYGYNITLTTPVYDVGMELQAVK